MKTVFTDLSAIAHLWANKAQYNARTSTSNFYFNGGTIYSYGSHFPIARHTESTNGEKAVLFTERSYSVTTSKHISIVRQATNHLNVIYCYNPESSHDQNFGSWKIEVENIASMLLKAKKPEKYLSEIERVKYKAEKYASFFGIEIPASLVAVLNIGNKAQYQEYNDNKQAIAQAQELKAKKENEKRHKKALTEWLKGKTHRLYTHNGYDYLRLLNGKVETTQAVEIPVNVAIDLYNKIKDNALKVGEQWLSYPILGTGKETKIGCHNFKTSYLLQFGSKLS